MWKVFTRDELSIFLNCHTVLFEGMTPQQLMKEKEIENFLVMTIWMFRMCINIVVEVALEKKIQMLYGEISSFPVTEQLSCKDGLPELDDQVQVLSVVSAETGLNRSVDAGAARGAAAEERTRWDGQSALGCCWGTCRVRSCFTSGWHDRASEGERSQCLAMHHQHLLLRHSTNML
ncbi:uncharacterized protein MONOS_6923 [Monocercomonoides exilis]|uniref:uncharacterized protein n=1 Tax=Monocercomonoides exilis TaxID=2049356 RepID=UPI00355953DE|nr:hypothetical protein MONOS_6923 [Monocercomonoides exilis]|eukprot:MONOS_6923.1-p1 / transcript=MONOS_6923.1 / gene=MONOS_6923 / organism=Monocercomonoides_exilis_PA203 / gene_product=unspecified product / transcript_product=unspecified product / location=Mono_scaffold00227:22378-23300(+) / protein_length=176 / sequence_SO=supercontig / SO=protein_coding / is_pseudo=false